ncbi:MAG: hypothetical protein FJ298_10870 [Planctomycetes bacterium]|nr:hypothetical protein [Planctomycetota bacterium]
MPHQPRRVLIGALFALFASWAAFPLLQAGLHGAELGLVERARTSRSLIDPALAGGHLLASLDLAATAGRAPAVVARLESFAWLLVAALALGRSARRILTPWSGGELARAAGWAASLVFALHPVSFAAVATLTARADLMALCFASLCLWAYLFARQERSSLALGLSGLCAVFAGLSSDLALSLPAWLAAAEFLSANRQRKLATRARSAALAALAGSACVLFDTWVRSLVLDEVALPSPIALASVSGLAGFFERLGALLFPVNAHVLGALGFVLAGLLALAAFQPILVAARAAPRLWGRILGLWALALALAEAVGRGVRVHPEDLRDAEGMLLSAAVLSVGLGLGSVAISGVRRVVMPLVLAIGFSMLAHSASLAHRAAARELGGLSAALETLGTHTAWIVDCPQTVLGVRCAEGALPERWNAAALERVSSRQVALRACSGELERSRAQGLALVLRGPAGWRARELSAPFEGSLTRSWIRDGISPELELDPLSVGALIVRATADADTARAPVLAWRSTSEVGVEDGRVEGVWAYLGEAPEAVFDLRTSLEWLAAGRVRQLWSAAGWSRIAQAELRPDLPEPALDGEWVRDADAFVLRAGGGLELDDERRSWRLCALGSDGVPVAASGERAGALLRFDARAFAQVSADPLLEVLVDGCAVERRRVRLPLR